MNKFLCLIFIGFAVISQIACWDIQTSQNSANFGRDKVFPTPNDENTELTIYLNEYVSAQNRKDEEKIFSMTYPKVIEIEGGRKAFLDKLNNSLKNAKDFAFLAGKPTQIVENEGKLLAVIPVSTKQKVADGWKFSREVIVAVSEDKGRRWAFADVSDTGKRNIIFPTEINKLEIPEIKPPWIEK